MTTGLHVQPMTARGLARRARHLRRRDRYRQCHARCGFRVVGRRERLGAHHGRCHDVVFVERRSTATGCDLPGVHTYPPPSRADG